MESGYHFWAGNLHENILLIPCLLEVRFMAMIDIPSDSDYKCNLEPTFLYMIIVGGLYCQPKEKSNYIEYFWQEM